MDYSRWDIVFNLLIAVFWFGAWGMDSRYAYFNSYLRPMYNRMEAVFAFLRPAFLRAPDRAIALSFVLVLILIRALVATRAAEWTLSLGTGPAGISAPFPRGPLTMALAWSALSTGLFLFKFWSLAALYLGFSRRPEGQVQTFLHALTAPFSWIHPVARLPALLATGIGMGLLLLHLGAGEPVTVLSGARALLAVVAAWVLLMGILLQAVLVVIVGHWIGAGTGSERLRWTCEEWLDHLLGPLRRRPVRIGMLDVTPLLFLLLLWALQNLLIRVSEAAVSMLP